MNVLIVGCGKVGSMLAQMLAAEGHDVSVVDRSEANLKRLGPDFPGYVTQGIPIDQDVLCRAGIENCDALAAVCAEDNVNIMVGEIAKKIYEIDNVLVRIYDAKKEDVFSELGLLTFCPTNLSAKAALDILMEKKEPTKLRIGNHSVHFHEVEAPNQIWDCDVSQVELSKNHFLFGVQSSSGTLNLCNGQKLKIQKGDTLIIGVYVD